MHPLAYEDGADSVPKGLLLNTLLKMEQTQCSETSAIKHLTEDGTDTVFRNVGY
jgi:hypothetical protein